MKARKTRKYNWENRPIDLIYKKTFLLLFNSFLAPQLPRNLGRRRSGGSLFPPIYTYFPSSLAHVAMEPTQEEAKREVESTEEVRSACLEWGRVEKVVCLGWCWWRVLFIRGCQMVCTREWEALLHPYLCLVYPSFLSLGLILRWFGSSFIGYGA